jgi:hypothetical protein
MKKTEGRESRATDPLTSHGTVSNSVSNYESSVVYFKCYSKNISTVYSASKEGSTRQFLKIIVFPKK